MISAVPDERVPSKILTRGTMLDEMRPSIAGTATGIGIMAGAAAILAAGCTAPASETSHLPVPGVTADSAIAVEAGTLVFEARESTTASIDGFRIVLRQDPVESCETASACRAAVAENYRAVLPDLEPGKVRAEFHVDGL